MAIIEKAFAIEAEQTAIWDALWHDLGEGDEGRFTVVTSTWPHSFTIDVELGGLPVQLSYEITPKDGFCEVAARIEPTGARYLLYQLVTFGHFRRNYEMVLAQGLVNLKAALEDTTDALEVEEQGV